MERLAEEDSFSLSIMASNPSAFMSLTMSFSSSSKLCKLALLEWLIWFSLLASYAVESSAGFLGMAGLILIESILSAATSSFGLINLSVWVEPRCSVIIEFFIVPLSSPS